MRRPRGPRYIDAPGDSYLDDWFDSIDRVLALDWERLIAGHPRQGGIGTKDDVRALKGYMTDLKEANEFLPGNIERMCFYWRNGWQ